MNSRLARTPVMAEGQNLSHKTCDNVTGFCCGINSAAYLIARRAAIDQTRVDDLSFGDLSLEPRT
jgi:hypothetical protein